MNELDGPAHRFLYCSGHFRRDKALCRTDFHFPKLPVFE